MKMADLVSCKESRMSVPKRALRWEASSAMGCPVVESKSGFRLPPAESVVSMMFSVPKIGFVPCR